MADTIEISEGLHIHYEDMGRGDPVILIPGWTFTTEIFEHNLNPLAQAHRVIAYDPRSHGQSTVTELGNDFAQRGEDLANLIKVLELKNVTLAGWSLGAYDAYAYLTKYGTEDIKSFICIDMPPKGIKLAEDDWAEADVEGMHGLFSGIMQPDQSELMHAYGQSMITRKASDGEINWIVNQSLKTPASTAALIVADAALLDYSTTARFLDKTLPVLHIVRDDWSQTALQWLRKNTPSAKIEVLGGHMMFWEFPEEFNRLILDFFEQIEVISPA